MEFCRRSPSVLGPLALFFILLLLLLLPGYLCEGVVETRVVGAPRHQPPPGTLPELLAASDSFFMAYFGNVKKLSDRDDLYVASVKPLKAPCSPVHSFTNFNLTFIREEDRISEEYFSFPFQNRKCYFLFLERTREEGVFRPLGAQTSDTCHGFPHLHSQISRYFKGR